MPSLGKHKDSLKPFGHFSKQAGVLYCSAGHTGHGSSQRAQHLRHSSGSTELCSPGGSSERLTRRTAHWRLPSRSTELCHRVAAASSWTRRHRALAPPEPQYRTLLTGWQQRAPRHALSRRGRTAFRGPGAAGRLQKHTEPATELPFVPRSGGCGGTKDDASPHMPESTAAARQPGP